MSRHVGISATDKVPKDGIEAEKMRIDELLACYHHVTHCPPIPKRIKHIRTWLQKQVRFSLFAHTLVTSSELAELVREGKDCLACARIEESCEAEPRSLKKKPTLKPRTAASDTTDADTDEAKDVEDAHSTIDPVSLPVETSLDETKVKDPNEPRKRKVGHDEKEDSNNEDPRAQSPKKRKDEMKPRNTDCRVRFPLLQLIRQVC